MDTTIYWLIALTVGFVGFMIYFFIDHNKMREDIDLAIGLGTVTALAIDGMQGGSAFTNTNKFDKETAKELLNKLKQKLNNK